MVDDSVCWQQKAALSPYLLALTAPQVESSSAKSVEVLVRVDSVKQHIEGARNTLQVQLMNLWRRDVSGLQAVSPKLFISYSHTSQNI